MATFIAELFAFVIILLVLYRYVWPIIQKLMSDRQEVIQEQVDESEAAARRLSQAEERFDSALAQARNEAARIRDDARADAHRLRAELREQADREVERIRQRGEEQLAARRAQTVRQLKAEIGGLIMALAERLVAESLADDQSKRASVDRFLTALDELPDSRSDVDSVDRVNSGADRKSAVSAGGTI